MRLGGRERRETANSTFAPLATAMVTTLGSKSRTKTIRFLSALAYASRLLAFFIGTVAEIRVLGCLSRNSAGG